MEQRSERGKENKTLIHLPAREVPQAIGVRVRDMTVKVKKITTTDDGKLQVVLESEAMDDHALAQVKDMLVLQQTCMVQVSMVPIQRDLFDA